MGDGVEGSEEYRDDNTGYGNAIKGCGADSAILRER